MPVTIFDSRPLAQRAYDELRRRILAGELAPGTPVVEDELAGDLGISRTPVREALRRLGEDGLVVAGDRQRARVSILGDAEAEGVREVRAALDALAAAACARRHRDLDLAPLQRQADAITALAEAGELGALFAADGAFHLALGAASGNRELLAHLARIDGRVQLVRLTTCRDAAQVRANVVRHHELLAAIARGDAEAAAAIARAHAGVAS